MFQEVKNLLKAKRIGIRMILFLCSASALLLIFIFQYFDYFTYLLGFFGLEKEAFGLSTRFIFNKAFRFLLNDLMTVLMIYAIFFERKYLIFAIYVQLAGFFLILIPYLIIKLSLPASEVRLVSFLHRLVMNPVLLMLLIPAFLYQKQLEKKASEH